ncbi:fibroblast growth factor receptor 3-like [Culex pipiens pallens]|uniref:fibroblast growth factor receptor 3-like n=1 Tax=Culex pipiens pallens TaxID=42434 RepID=UPI0022AAE701|nr:fibroblast growth factor receptor 3-like [Culex pipiens pallens]
MRLELFLAFFKIFTIQASNAFLDEDQPISKPKFTKPQRLVLFQANAAGESISFKCTAAGNPTPNITWTKDGEVIQPGVRVRFTKWQIILSDLEPSDQGLYRCTVCNIVECIGHTTQLEVLSQTSSRPRFLTDYPKNETVLVNLEAILECRTFSGSDVAISWVKVHLGVDDELPDNVTELHRGGNLVFKSVTFDDEGWYSCIAVSSYGTSVRSVYLRVVDYDSKLPSLVFFWYICIVFSIFAIFATRNVILRTNQSTNFRQSYVDVVKIDRNCSREAQNSNYETHGNHGYEYPNQLEFPRDQLILGKVLGEGAFGRVVQAEAKGLIAGTDFTAVAVKMLKKDHTEGDINDLLSEMDIMKMVGSHPNIINFLGFCNQDGPPLIIVEYAAHGNLKDFLRRHQLSSDSTNSSKPTLTLNELVSFAYQVANGMNHLSSMKCVHRDLAARNILVSEGHVMKISDFGLARDVHSREYYRKLTSGELPIRWMAPESLEKLVFDSHSDAWSFGVLWKSWYLTLTAMHGPLKCSFGRL